MKKNSRTSKVKDAAMLNDRFRRAIEVFGDDKAKRRSWRCFEDFRKSVNDYYDVAKVWFDGEGYLTLKYAKALLAFNEAINGFCTFSENNDIEDIQAIQASPHFHNVEQKAQDFFAVSEKNGSEGRKLLPPLKY